MDIIIIPMYGIGDTLMTTPAIRILKEKLPDCKITYLSMFSSTYEVLERNPYIDNNIYFPFLNKSKFETLNFIRPFRGRFDCSINFYTTNRKDYNILAFLIRAPKRIGHRYANRNAIELNFLKNNTIMEDNNLHNVEENTELLSFLGIHTNMIPPTELFLTAAEIEAGGKHIVQSGRKKIGIHAGTSTFKGHSGRRWPAERFIELIRTMTDTDFYLFGGYDDKSANEFIFSELTDIKRVFLLDNRPIREVAACIKNLDLFISNDSGLMHLAAAVKTPVVALFGPTNPAYVRPWGVKHEVVRADTLCFPCFYYSPKSLKCDSDEQFHCIKSVTVDMVIRAIDKLNKRINN